jgi:signal transduction histidine kinase
MIVAVTFYSTLTSQKSLQDSIGQNLIFVAKDMLVNMNMAIYDWIDRIEQRAATGSVIASVSASNKEFEASGVPLSYLNQIEKNWTVDENGKMSFSLQRVIESDLSRELKNQFAIHFEKKLGFQIVDTFVVTNKYGATVAERFAYEKYRFDNNLLWQKAKESGSSVGEVEMSQRTGQEVVPFAVPIIDIQNKFLGTIMVDVTTDSIIRNAIITYKKYENTQIRLIALDGKLIYSTKPYQFMEDISTKPYFQNIKGESGSFISVDGGRQTLFSYARSQKYLTLAGMPWILIVGNDVNEVLIPSFNLRNNIIFMSGALFVLGLLFAFVLSRSITKPIVALQRAATEVAKGNLTYKIEFKGKDEISMLAQSFNQMAASISNRIEEKERSAQQLLTVNKEIKAFSYSISHDLRSPLRAIAGYTRILLEDYSTQLDAEGKRICTVISDGAKNMGKLIDDILAFSRLGQAEMQRSSIDMTALAKAVFLEITTPESRERIDFNVEPLHVIMGDPVLIRQVWTNLLTNAIKFSSKKERAIIKVSDQTVKNEVIFSIHDNGAGFNMAYIDKLFGVFQRLHSTTEFEGTGVGLAIVQRIVQRHGGRIWAEGEIDKGATFSFTIEKGE